MLYMRYAWPGGTELFDEIDSPKHGQFPDRAGHRPKRRYTSDHFVDRTVIPPGCMFFLFSQLARSISPSYISHVSEDKHILGAGSEAAP